MPRDARGLAGKRDGDSIPGAIQQLLDNPLVNSGSPPASAGAVEASLLQGGADRVHRSDPALDTADSADMPGPGNCGRTTCRRA